MLTFRVQRFIKKTGRNLDFKGKQPVTFDKLKVECYNGQRKWHFAKECRSGRNQGKRSNDDNGRRNATSNEPSSQALVAQDGLGGYDRSNDFDELVNYALMAISSLSSSSSSDNEVQNYSKQCLESFKTLQKNYDSERDKRSRARLEIQGYELALESLESRILRHEKNELAWGEKYEFQNYELKCRELKIGNLKMELEKVIKERDELKVRSSNEVTTLANDRFSKVDGYHTVPPPIIGNFLTPRSDISFAGLDEYDIIKKINDSKTTELNTDTSKSKTTETVDDEDDVSEVNTVSPVKTNVIQTIKTQVDKIGQTSQKEGIGFKKVKACFVCKSTDHLIKDCDFYAKKSPEPKLKTMANTSQRGVKPVWDNAKRDHAVVDSGCSSHMTGNKAYHSDYEDYNGGFVAFGSDPKGGKITGKGKIKTAYLDFDDVYFLLDESQVVLRAPRQNDMYSLDLKNIVPSGGITCLYTNATSDESKLWHMRLGHVNFKNINKLVKGHLVRGLPSKVFVNDHTCVACKKGKQHKASYKAKLDKTIRKPLELLHMDLFGPVLVETINKKKYCLVVTDDFSRFSWVFFLASKDETNEILYKFITGLENQLNHKVKIIRSDHGTEFKNHAMNVFCAKTWIKREFSVARTPQQNGVAERKNRTLIEAARTMLADSLLPIPFWVKAVNTVCYVLNSVLVTKPQKKTPYELLIGKPPSISFMRPFGCPLTILNTLDPLGKFDGKSDEGYLLRYSTSTGNGPDWMFDLDFLTNTMNYIPVSIENQDSEDIAKKEEQHNLTETEQALKDDLEKLVTQEMIAKAMDDATRQAFEEEKKNIASIKRAAQATSINKLNTGRQSVGTTNTPYVSAASTPIGANSGESSFVYLGGQIPIDASTLPNADLPTDPNMPNLEDDSDVFSNEGIFSGAYDDEDKGAEADFNNMDNTIDVSPIPTLRIHKDHPKG
ncbi:putative ribonuclease H-like domain-containing protein [Tanacetum coccineum]